MSETTANRQQPDFDPVRFDEIIAEIRRTYGVDFIGGNPLEAMRNAFISLCREVAEARGMKEAPVSETMDDRQLICDRCGQAPHLSACYGPHEQAWRAGGKELYHLRMELAEARAEAQRKDEILSSASYPGHYISTACQAALHSQCRGVSKWGGEPCHCTCGHTQNTPQPTYRELTEQAQRKDERIKELTDWMKAANQFAWAHETTCPRMRNGNCTCGLDAFLGRPRPTIESFKSRIASLESALEEARRDTERLEAVVENGWLLCDTHRMNPDDERWIVLRAGSDEQDDPTVEVGAGPTMRAAIDACRPTQDQAL